MEQSKRERLEKEGWKIGSASDFLELSADESAYLDLKLELAGRLQKKPPSKRYDPGPARTAIEIKPIACR